LQVQISIVVYGYLEESRWPHPLDEKTT